MKNMRGRKINPRSKRLRDIMIKYEVSNRHLTEALKYTKSCTMISRILTGSYMHLHIDILASIANFFHVSISDIYDTRCVVDEENRVKLLTLEAVLDDIKILAKLRKTFTTDECMYLTEMLKNFEFEKAIMPKHFLINTILEADYYTDLQAKYQVKSQILSEKIEELNELEAFALVSRILSYNGNQEVVIDKLFYKESLDEKRQKIKNL